MARLLVTNKSDTHTAVIVQTDDSYLWLCSCDETGEARRLADAIEYASQHVDATHIR